MSKYYLGIDTSCYTTSLSVIDDNSNILFDKRIILDVPYGKNGLRQSEMVFQHMNNIPKLFKQIPSDEINFGNLVSLAVSDKPRNIEGSYMPAFLAGVNFGEVIAHSLSVDTHFLSHQENHIYAASLGTSYDYKKRHISVHMSGGTTEILLSEFVDSELKLSIIGGTKDLSFGQLVDRIGVNLGLEFPCGALMDKLSAKTTRKPPKVKTDGYFNISGMENYFKNITDLVDGEVYYLLFSTISNILYDSIIYLSNKYKVDEVMLVGGVSSNSVIKTQLSSKLDTNGINCYIADPQYCRDNAIGSAYYSLIKSNKL